MPSLCNSLHASTLEFGDSAPISAVSALPRLLLGPRMRNSEGVPKDGGKHPNFSAETENDPGPAGAPGRAPDSGMVCCDAWREGRRSGPVPGFAHARKMWPTNGGRPSGPTSPRCPDGLPPGAVAHTQGAAHNGTSGLRACAKGLPCRMGGVAPEP